jgi:CheY-like chemotaxis protein
MRPGTPARHAPKPDIGVGLSLRVNAGWDGRITSMTCSVLVVDDDRDFRGLAARMIAAMGLTVVAEAGTCAAATTAAADLRPDAALVDIGLPDGDGLVLAQQLAALPWRPRVVLTSSDPEATTDAVASRLGAVGFVAKQDLTNGSLRGMLAGG